MHFVNKASPVQSGLVAVYCAAGKKRVFLAVAPAATVDTGLVCKDCAWSVQLPQWDTGPGLLGLASSGDRGMVLRQQELGF